MICEKIIEKLNQDFPKRYAEGWDNPGLLVGRSGKEISTVFISLDASIEAIRQAAACKADLMITHHPVIFSGCKSVTDDTIVGKRVLALIEGGINCFAMHTNFDVAAMARINAEQINLQNVSPLEMTEEEDGKALGIGSIGELDTPSTLAEYAAFVKKALGLPSLRMYGAEDQIIRRAAILGGSGKSAVESALKRGADVFITGDLDYHTCLDASEQGMAILDAGHYGTEYVFIAYMREYFEKNFPDLKTYGAKIAHPFVSVSDQPV